MAAKYPKPLDLKSLKVYPLASRQSMSTVEKVLVEPANDPPPISDALQKSVRLCATRIKRALEGGAGVMLIYGAHLIKNGGQLLLNRFLDAGWLTHLATNGAGIIHDWEFAFLGRSTESVRDNVATGSFGTWDETGRYIHLALLVGGIQGEGFGRSLGRFINQDGTLLPKAEELEALLRKEPAHPLAAARADLLRTMREHLIPSGPMIVVHRWRNACVLAHAFRQDVPLTVHPGIGYDIISNHPMFNGAVLGRAAEIDFKLFSASVDTLDNGVVMSVGSAIMGPQVFEKSISCVNNLRLQAKRKIVQGHSLFVVDLQDGGNWDWSKGEPPTDNPAYYLRFCKSFSRMGGTMHYLQCDNVGFLHHLYHALRKL
jgi:hypothetical protein